MRALAIAVVLAPLAVAHAAPPPGAAGCSGCHATTPDVPSPVPRLAGRSATDIVAAMQAFRDGAREATVMDRIARGFTDDEVRAIAAWFEAAR